MLPPHPTKRRLQRAHDIETNFTASASAVYASRTASPLPMQDSLPAGWLAFAGREFNPLDQIERFQFLHLIPLSRAYPDASWAHLRRKVIEAEKAAPEIAREAIELVRALYVVEKHAKDLSVLARLELRQEKSAPVLALLREKLLEWKEQLLPKHPMAEAVNYALGQWAELNVFCSDGAVAIDNNVSEREMKRVVLNRKNSLFVGNPRGGRTAAILASLTSSCRRHDIDPQLYLTQLLTNLSQVRKSELPNWLPDQWKRLQAARLPS